MGDCYQAAAKFVTGHQNGTMTLVHGVVTGTGGEVEGKEFGHAWVELGDLVFEVANGRKQAVPREAYYAAGQVGMTRRYDAQEALTQMLTTGHWGPWDECFEGVA
jgi:hypothetical protein